MARPPSPLLLPLEIRPLFELLLLLAWRPVLERLPRGDGRPVLVLPGFLANSVTTTPLRRFLRRRGYSAHRWRLGRNLGYTEALHDGMTRRIRELADRHGRKLTLIGWSLGAAYARELARESPDLVGMVITLGSPHRGVRYTRALGTYRWVTGDDPLELEARIEHRLEPPPVPITAIYSLTDAIVSWRASIEELGHDCVENVGLHGAHLGLGNMAPTWIVLADRLAQPEGVWRPFQPPRSLRWLYYGIQNRDRPAPPRGWRELFTSPARPRGGTA